MTLIQLKASLALWERREKTRKILHTRAQQDLLEARAAGAAVMALERRRDLRSRQLQEARDRIKLRLDQIEAKQAKNPKVRRPHERIKKNVVNRSSRLGVKPRLIVIHSTESHNRPKSDADLQAIVAWFDNPASQASSHVIVDADGYSARCVPDAEKAWTQASYNPQALSIEMIGFASQARSAWSEAQYKKTAQYLAYWSKEYNIPLERSTVKGVTRHMDLGAAGGGHHDPGVNFDLDKLITWARKLRDTGW